MRTVIPAEAGLISLSQDPLPGESQSTREADIPPEAYSMETAPTKLIETTLPGNNGPK